MEIQPVFPDDIAEYGWLGLRKFTNENLVRKLLIERHSIPKSHHHNAKKQAQQIRQCLIQAEEYHKSVAHVSDAIRPLLLYYSTLSLALAEILLKGDGLSSLDKARGKHAHHGLELTIRDNPSDSEDPIEAAKKIIAKPHFLKNRERFGTFELWHRTAFEQPICGEARIVIEPGKEQSNFQKLANVPDSPLEKIPEVGVSLLWCLQNAPAVRQALASYGIPSLHVRSHWRREINFIENFQEDTIITHPNLENIVQSCVEKILVPPGDYENFQIDEIPNGYSIVIRNSKEHPLTGGSFPNAVQVDTRNVFLLSDNQFLNEFGIYYMGLYLLGNYCRYFPDLWMKDFENSSPLYFLSSRFMSAAEKRLPLLTLSQFSGRWPILISGTTR